MINVDPRFSQSKLSIQNLLEMSKVHLQWPDSKKHKTDINKITTLVFDISITIQWDLNKPTIGIAFSERTLKRKSFKQMDQDWHLNAAFTTQCPISLHKNQNQNSFAMSNILRWLGLSRN